MRRGAARGTRRPGHVPGRRGRVWLPCTQRARRPRPAGRPCTRRLATAAPAASRDRGFTPCLPGSRTQIRGRVRNPGTAGDPLPECAAAAARGSTAWSVDRCHPRGPATRCGCCWPLGGRRSTVRGTQGRSTYRVGATPGASTPAAAAPAPPRPTWDE